MNEGEFNHCEIYVTKKTNEIYSRFGFSFDLGFAENLGIIKAVILNEVQRFQWMNEHEFHIMYTFIDRKEFYKNLYELIEDGYITIKDKNWILEELNKD